VVVVESVGKIVNENGDITWICPRCRMPDDGTPMIGCDECDDWYHWTCVGIVEEPKDAEWFCTACKGKGGDGGKKKSSTGAGLSGRSKKGKKK